MAAPVFIMRGISGSGKSYTAKLIRDTWDSLKEGMGLLDETTECVIVSADDYFIWDDGSYHFDASVLKDAHASCKDHFRMALTHPNAAIIVDNTNTRRWEYNDYVVAAREAGRPVEIVRLVTTPAAAAARNKHGLTFEMVQKQFDRFQDDPAEQIITGE